jgi:hypothetical protein
MRQQIIIKIANQVNPESSLSKFPLDTEDKPLITPPMKAKKMMKIKNKIQNMCLIF